MEIKFIIVHCSATPEGRDVTAADIDRWHRQRGFAKIGYHYVVRLDGTVERGRPEGTVGAHCHGKNGCSIGVCYIGGVARDGRTPKDTRTPAQRAALVRLLRELKRRYPAAKICGHRDFAAKACPSFDATAEYRALGLAAVAGVALNSCSTHRDTAVRGTVDIEAGRRMDVDLEMLMSIIDSVDLKVYRPEIQFDTLTKMTADSVVVRRVSKAEKAERINISEADTARIKATETISENVTTDPVSVSATKTIGLLVGVVVICIIIKKWFRR